MSLAQLQQRWQQAILQADSEIIKEFIVPVTNETTGNRLHIYIDGYFARLSEILTTTFPALLQWMGEAAFYEVSFHYLQTYPSTHFSTEFIGKNFASSQSIAAYCELAELEWAIHCARYPQDIPILTKANLLAIPQAQWGDLIFVCHPALKKLTFTTNALTVYQAYAQQQHLPSPAESAVQYCRVWHYGQQAYYSTMTPLEAIFLCEIQQAQPLSQICDNLCHHLPETEVTDFAIQQLLIGLDQGMLTGVRDS